jgi:hypothetical protein
MKKGMTIDTLLETVKEQAKVKRDYVANTKHAVRMVPMPDFPDGVALVLLRDADNPAPSGEVNAAPLDRFKITDHTHRQISARLKIPFKYYKRLLNDYPDMVMDNVNKLLEREPENRMIRVLGDKARAYLSDRYLRLDNDAVLLNVLPPLVNGNIENVLLSSNVSDDYMRIKVLFTDDRLKQDVGPLNRRPTLTGSNVPGHEIVGKDCDEGRDIIRPMGTISTSETGAGALRFDGGFFRAFCYNGCVYGRMEAFTFKRPHLGGKVVPGDGFQIFSDDTKRKQDDVIMAELTDCLSAMTDPARVQAMGDQLRALRETEPVKSPTNAVHQLARELPFNESEKEPMLEALIRDMDYSKWGMMNAVTSVANSDDVSYDRATELEQLGWKIADLTTAQWGRVVNAEKIAA